jgi:UDP-N-acetyl-D-glucosamine dehydrogenase
MDIKTRFIDLADEVNRSMPSHAAEGIAELLNECAKPVKGSSILLLGVAYKKNVGDIRESPAIDVAKHLNARGARLSYHDPYVWSFLIEESEAPRLEIPRVQDLTKEVLASYDAVAILTDHASIDYKFVVENSAAVYDARNATLGLDGSAVVHRLGAGE